MTPNKLPTMTKCHHLFLVVKKSPYSLCRCKCKIRDNNNLYNRREIIKMLGGCSKKGVGRNCPKMLPIISIFKRRKYKIRMNLLKYCISRRLLRSPNKIRNGSIISLERSKTIKKYSNTSKI